MSTETTDVIICGGGPTGAVLSALLGRAGVKNVVLERDAEINVDPRGIALDEDGIRVLQAVGVYDKIFTEIGSCMQRFNFIGGTCQRLHRKPMLSFDYGTSEGGTGHPGFICHKQPVLEKAIRDVIVQTSCCDFRPCCTVIAIEEDTDRVLVRYLDASGDERRLSGSFLVGADGKTGFVRKKYLEPRGISMDRCEGTNYDEVWVAVNWKISLPAPKSHPEFPLWELGWDPQQVYDRFFPQEFRFLCNPSRPAVCGRFGLPEDRLWRFEFVVHPKEDGMKMASPEELDKIILPYLTHPGEEYGRHGSIQYPADCIETLRARPFSFSARSCNSWALGRVVIAGDAAHVFPPFGGQGITSGFRDALGLAWRLQFLVDRPHLDHNQILAAWYVERKQQLERSLAATIQNGEYVTESNPVKVFIRDWWLWLQHLSPSRTRELEKGPRALGMTSYSWSRDLPFLQTGGGKLLPQVYAKDLVTEKILFSDDLLFSGDKKGTFQILALANSVDDGLEMSEQLGSLTSTDLVHIDESTILVQSIDTAPITAAKVKRIRLARVATGEEFASSELCRGRPEPRYYDPLRLAQEYGGTKYLVVRPDRFVYAACRRMSELSVILQEAGAVISQRTT